jgi:hypothetical protein
VAASLLKHALSVLPRERERDTKDGNQPSHHTDPAKDSGVPSALRATLPSSLGGFAVHTLCLVWRVGRLRVMARRAVSTYLSSSGSDPLERLFFFS